MKLDPKIVIPAVEEELRRKNVLHAKQKLAGLERNLIADMVRHYNVAHRLEDDIDATDERDAAKEEADKLYLDITDGLLKLNPAANSDARVKFIAWHTAMRICQQAFTEPQTVNRVGEYLQECTEPLPDFSAYPSIETDSAETTIDRLPNLNPRIVLDHVKEEMHMNELTSLTTSHIVTMAQGYCLAYEQCILDWETDREECFLQVRNQFRSIIDGASPAAQAGNPEVQTFIRALQIAYDYCEHAINPSHTSTHNRIEKFLD
jgi:hypothetical protein